MAGQETLRTSQLDCGAGRRGGVWEEKNSSSAVVTPGTGDYPRRNSSIKWMELSGNNSCVNTTGEVFGQGTPKIFWDCLFDSF